MVNFLGLGLLFFVTLGTQAGFGNEAVAVHSPDALGTGVSTFTAAVLAGSLIPLQALTARAGVAHVAGRNTVGAVVLLTILAELEIIGVCNAVAIGATPPVPAIDGYIRRGGVVGGQDRSDQAERVVDPTLPQGLGNRNRGVAGAQLLVLNVGMRDILVAGGRIRLQGHAGETGHIRAL